MTDQSPRTPQGVHSRDIDGELVVVDPVSGNAHLLTGQAADAWRVLEGHASPNVASEAGLDAGLSSLAEAGLITDGSLTRRDILRRGATVAAAGAIITIGLPTANAAASHDIATAVSLDGSSTGPNAVTLTATLAYTNPSVNAPGPATGSIAFYEGATEVGRNTNVSGPGPYSLSLTGVSAGSHTYTAKYLGDDHHLESATSNTKTITVAAPAPVAPTYVNGGGASTTGTSVSIAKPTGVTTGDVMVAHVTVLADRVITAPTGWALIKRTGNAASPTLIQAIYYKVATASEGSTYAFNVSGTSVRINGAILAYRGAHQSTPFGSGGSGAGGELIAAQGESAGSPTAPQLATGGAERVAVAFWATTKGSLTVPSPFTERTKTQSSALSTATATQTLAAAGNAGPATASTGSSSSVPSIGHMLIVRGPN